MNANDSQNLAQEIWSETGMQELLGCTKKQLRRLTLEGGLPAIRLERGLYVYLAGDVRRWLADKKNRPDATVTDIETGATTP
jgi:hypothetical protein